MLTLKRSLNNNRWEPTLIWHVMPQCDTNLLWNTHLSGVRAMPISWLHFWWYCPISLLEKCHVHRRSCRSSNVWINNRETLQQAWVHQFLTWFKKTQTGASPSTADPSLLRCLGWTLCLRTSDSLEPPDHDFQLDHEALDLERVQPSLRGNRFGAHWRNCYNRYNCAFMPNLLCMYVFNCWQS